MKKAVLLTVGFIALVLLCLHLYYNVFNKGYEDKKYGFLLLNTRGWKILDRKEGVYLSLRTEKDATAMRKSCDNLIADTNARFVDFKEIEIGDLRGYTCNYEVIGVNLKEPLNASSITLFGKSTNSYDYVISTAFPKNNQGETERVETLVNNFWVN